MLDSQSLQWLMARERLKDEVNAIERQCETIVHRFDELEREPTIAERDSRRHDFMDNRARLSALIGEIGEITQRLRDHH